MLIAFKIKISLDLFNIPSAPQYTLEFFIFKLRKHVVLDFGFSTVTQFFSPPKFLSTFFSFNVMTSS